MKVSATTKAQERHYWSIGAGMPIPVCVAVDIRMPGPVPKLNSDKETNLPKPTKQQPKKKTNQKTWSQTILSIYEGSDYILSCVARPSQGKVWLSYARLGWCLLASALLQVDLLKWLCWELDVRPKQDGMNKQCRYVYLLCAALATILCSWPACASRQSYRWTVVFGDYLQECSAEKLFILLFKGLASQPNLWCAEFVAILQVSQ